MCGYVLRHWKSKILRENVQESGPASFAARSSDHFARDFLAWLWTSRCIPQARSLHGVMGRVGVSDLEEPSISDQVMIRGETIM